MVLNILTEHNSKHAFNDMGCDRFLSKAAKSYESGQIGNGDGGHGNRDSGVVPHMKSFFKSEIAVKLLKCI